MVSVFKTGKIKRVDGWLVGIFLTCISKRIEIELVQVVESEI